MVTCIMEANADFRSVVLGLLPHFIKHTLLPALALNVAIVHELWSADSSNMNVIARST